ncbi:MAG TPA: Smr/MutS family protein [Methylovirgula sp.]
MKDAPPPARRRLRRLSDEEIALWLSVTKSVTRRAEAVLPTLTNPLPEPKAETAPAADVAQHIPPKQARAVELPRLAPLDRRLRQRLTRGQTGVDHVIDLHGLHQHEAHSALHRFLARAQGDGAKLVLVVTGKGEGRAGDDYGGGVLRRAVPMWLRAADWRALVVGFEEASRPHGGAGALYVRLRRLERPAFK